MSLLEMRGINKSFGSIQVLFDVDFELEAGEVHCLIGENGAGKSTLVKILTGVYNDYKGSVKIDDIEYRMTNPSLTRKLGIYTIQQSKDLALEMDAVDNIFMGNHIMKGNFLDWETMKAKSRELLNSFGVEINQEIPVGELRASEQSIVAICKALAANSKILLVDEASAALDSSERLLFYSILENLKEQGVAIVYISHHLEEVYNVGDRVTVLRNGRNVCTLHVKDTVQKDLIDAMTGNKELYERDADRDKIQFNREEVPILKFENVTTAHISDITFDIASGEVVGFAGLEGSNKHFISECMLGIDKVLSGKISLKGELVNYKHVIDAVRNQVGYMPNDRKNQGILLCRNIIENITITSVIKSKTPFVSWQKMKKATEKQTVSMNIVCANNRQLVQYLSGGNQQKVLLGRWFQAETEVLMLNEPTEGIDVGARADIYRILHGAADIGKTLIIFSSDLDELLTLCDRIFTIANGKIVNCYQAGTAEKKQLLSDILMEEKAVG